MSKLYCLPLLMVLVGCSPKVMTNSTVIRQIDSVVVHQDTVQVPIPVERYVDIVVPPDTLRLESSVAEATAWYDTSSRYLRGSLVNKSSLPAVVRYVDRVSVRDSIVTVEVPVVTTEVVTRYPKSYWVLLSIVVGLVVYVGVRIYFKLKS